MNTETLVHWLEVAGVPAEVVSIGAEADDAWCLLRCGSAADDGDSEDAGAADRDEWEVFWREQGNRYDWARFTNEQVACFYLFGRLAWTQTAAGVLRAATADTDLDAAAAPAAPAPVATPAAPAPAAAHPTATA